MNTLAKTRPGTIASADPDIVAPQTLRRLAVRHLTMHAEIDLIEQQLELLARQVNPTLLSLSGVGPVTAATLLVAAGDNPERLGTRATFAALAGVARSPPRLANAHGTGSREEGNRHANAPCTGSCSCGYDTANLALSPTSTGSAEQLTDRDIMCCLKRHVANEVHAALLNPATDNPAGRELRARRQALGIPTSVLAGTLVVPYQRPRRLEIGTRTDPELEHPATLPLEHTNPPRTAPQQ